VRIAGPDNSSGFGDGAITTESQNDHGSSESGFSGRLAFSPIGTQALQELLGSKLLVLSQRTSGLSLIKSITMPNISGAAYKWNRDIAYAKVSKFETSGGGLVGFDGQKLVCFQYRLLSLDGKGVLVGEVFKLLEGAEAKRAFDKGLGGMSMYSAAGESHVIASLTGEMYSDIMGTLPAKSIPRKN